MTGGASRETRSKIMSSIKSSGTEIEKKICQILTDLGIQFESQPKDVFGKPDFVIRNRRIAIFCDGDFWHGYDFENNPRHSVKTNREFWLSKINQNMKRDQLVTLNLESTGWTVLRFWEHDIKSRPKFCMSKIQNLFK